MDVFLTDFSKKLLVAISIVVFLTMCLTQSEARATRHNRLYERQQPNMLPSLTKVTDARRSRHRNAMKNNMTIAYKNSLRKIKRQLKVAIRFFNQDKKVLSETREYSDGNPGWLPKVNFVDIHKHNHNEPRSAGVIKIKFKYLMPKLYKSLMEYRTIFEQMKNMTIDHGDDNFYYYKEYTRRRLIDNILTRLYPLITAITDEMGVFNMTPYYDVNKLNLSSFKMHVDSTLCLKQDYIAFRGYGNLLNHWQMELVCPKRSKGRMSADCRNYELSLQMKNYNRQKKRNNSK